MINFVNTSTYSLLELYTDYDSALVFKVLMHLWF